MTRSGHGICAVAVVAGILTAAPAAGLSATPARPAVSASLVHTATAPAPRFDPVLEWALAHLDAGRLWERTQGAGVIVAVVDTGIDAGQQDLADAVVESIGQPSDGGTSDEAHGTEVAGLIAGRGSPTDPEQMAGLAPEAALIDIRVAAQPDHVSPDQIAAGITSAVQAGAQIINVSLTTSTGDPRLQQAVNDALAHDCLVVASAGDTDQPEYPAGYKGILAVGEADINSHPLTSLTAFGAFAIYAPGTDLYSTAATGRDDYVYDLNGSDYATAFASAAAALLLSADPRLNPQKAGRLLVQAATPSGKPAGNLDVLAALNLLSSPSPTPRPSPKKPVPIRHRHSGATLVLKIAVLLAVVIFLLFVIASRHFQKWARNPPTSWDEPW